MERQTRIIVLTASAGAGHNIAARAMEEALRVEAPDAKIEVLDVLDRSNTFFRLLYAQGYLSLVKHAPTGMGILYESMDRPEPGLREFLRVAFQNMNVRNAMRYLVRLDPHLIINTHFLPAEFVAFMRRRGRLTCPQVTVTTDFETHRMWAQNPTERYYTATDEGRAYLCTWGVDADSVRVTGIPVRAAFRRMASTKAQMRAAHGLDNDRPVILMLCGGFGVAPTEQLLKGLLSIRTPAQVVIATGRNERLRRRLSSIARPASSITLRFIGFTDRMHELMRAADLLVSKPGGLTVSEALVSGLPLVVVNPIPGQESRNSDYLLERGAAIKVNNPRLLGYRIDSLLGDPARLQSLRTAVLLLARPAAAVEIAKDALSLIGQPPKFDKGHRAKNNPQSDCGPVRESQTVSGR